MTHDDPAQHSPPQAVSLDEGMQLRMTAKTLLLLAASLVASVLFVTTIQRQIETISRDSAAGQKRSDENYGRLEKRVDRIETKLDK